MAKAQKGDRVQVHYTGSLQDGTTFDSSEGRNPLEFKIGEGRIIPCFEKAVIGMELGESKTETVSAGDAYGHRRPELVFEVEKSRFRGDTDPQEGQRLELTQEDGQKVPVTVVSVKEDMVSLDGNHPLAGQDLTFQIDLVSIQQ